MVQLSTSDMFGADSDSGSSDDLARGSQRGASAGVYAQGSDVQTFDDTVDVEDGAGEETVSGASPPKFKEVDTVLTSFLDRKR